MKNEKRRMLITCVCFLFGFIAVCFAIKIIAGDNFRYRESRSNIDMKAAESGSIELVQGNCVEQLFVTKIARLKSVSVQFGTYLRANSGNVSIQLFESGSGELLLQEQFNAGEITEGQTLTINFQTPFEAAYGKTLLLRISGDSVPGSAVSPLVNTTAEFDPAAYALYYNGEPAAGILCFSAEGEEYIWAGLHYRAFVFLAGAILFLYLAISYLRFCRGKSTVLSGFLAAIRKYRFLIKQLVARDFKAKYKRSVLGVFWSFLNPLLTMLVQYIVFSNLFKFDIAYFPVYLLVGTIFFNYFSEATGMALTSVVGNSRLITKVYAPKYIYPLTRVLSSLINLLISFLPLLAVTLLSGLAPTRYYFLLIYDLACLVIFCLGIGLMLAAAMVFFRDTQFLWGVLTMIWMYLTPLFYPENILDDRIKWVLDINPMYYYIKFARLCIMDAQSPEPLFYLQCLLMAIITLVLGLLVFKRTQDKFVLYL